MKRIKTLSIYAIAAFMAACSSDNDSSTDVDEGTKEETPTEVDGSTKFSADVTKISVVNSSGAVPKKGDEISIVMTVKNTDSESGKVKVGPKISSNRFEDFEKVSIEPLEVSLNGDETAEVTIMVGPFVQDVINEKLYALNRGEYVIETVALDDLEDTSFEGGTFDIETSNKILVPVLYDPSYLGKLEYTESIEDYLKMAFTRKVEVFDNGDYTVFDGGMDEMMDIEHVFYPISTINVSDYALDNGLCEKTVALAGEELGLGGDWSGPDIGTQTGNHGFDYLIGLTPNSFGGTTCASLDVQVTGTHDFDLSINRSQLILAHQTGHILGAVHCDSSQSFVMCAGDKNPMYISEGTYVFDIDSRNQMQNRFE